MTCGRCSITDLFCQLSQYLLCTYGASSARADIVGSSSATSCTDALKSATGRFLNSEPWALGRNLSSPCPLWHICEYCWPSPILRCSKNLSSSSSPPSPPLFLCVMGLPSSSRPMQTCADPCSCHTLRRLLQLCVGLCAITAAVLLLHVPGRIPWSHFLCWAGESASAGDALSPQQLSRLSSGRHMCQQWNTSPVLYASPVPQSRKNPRWQPELADTDGDIEEGTLLLRNATLFDGQTWLPYPVDIELHCGVIRAISPTTIAIPAAAAVVQDLQGRHVTPGLVDMHAHQMIGTFPLLDATAEFNEFGLGPLTPFLHAMHGLKPYDPAVRIILAGGITSSLILPGSSNIMGGEGVLVKNALDRGVGREPVVDALRLEHGIEPAQRRRYMKMACGENPKGIHGHVRTGTSWLLRDHLHHAASLRDAQDAWCDAVHAADSAHDVARLATLAAEGAPDNLALASTVALLRGQIDAHVHCYEPEDMEMMLAHTAEAGFAVRAFHHALDAWKVPNMLKTAAYVAHFFHVPAAFFSLFKMGVLTEPALSKNITIATFVEFGGFKKEAYDSNLWAGRILAEHGIDLAYKSVRPTRRLHEGRTLLIHKSYRTTASTSSTPDTSCSKRPPPMPSICPRIWPCKQSRAFPPGAFASTTASAMRVPVTTPTSWCGTAIRCLSVPRRCRSTWTGMPSLMTPTRPL